MPDFKMPDFTYHRAVSLLMLSVVALVLAIALRWWPALIFAGINFVAGMVLLRQFRNRQQHEPAQTRRR